MGYTLLMGSLFEDSGLEWVLRCLSVLICEFMIFLDLVETTGSHLSFTHIGRVLPTPPPATHTHTYLGILGGRGLLEMYYPECTPPVSWRNERWREGPAGGRREQHGSQLPCPESILCSCSWMGGWPQGLRHPSGTKNFKAHQEKLCFWAGCFQSSLPLKS